MSLKTLLSRFKPATYHIKKPHIPDYILATDPTIALPSVFGINGSYRPKTGDVTLTYNSIIATGIFQNGTLTINTHKSKEIETDHYLRYYVLNEDNLAKAFIDANKNPFGDFSIAAKLMLKLSDNSSESYDNVALYGLETLPNGTTPLGNHMLIHEDNTFIILTTRNVLVLKRDGDLDLPRYTITHDMMSAKTFGALDECYEVGQALESLSYNSLHQKGK